MEKEEVEKSVRNIDGEREPEKVHYPGVKAMPFVIGTQDMILRRFYAKWFVVRVSGYS